MMKIIIPIAALMLISGDINLQQSGTKNLPRILFVGDQITRGINDSSGFGFRDHVQSLLGLGLWDYVGPYADPPSHRLFDVDHSGEEWDWSGHTRSNIKKLLEEFMDSHAKGDWVLIHLGTVSIINDKISGILDTNTSNKKLNEFQTLKRTQRMLNITAETNAVMRRKIRSAYGESYITQLDGKQFDNIVKLDLMNSSNFSLAETAIKQIIDEITAFNPHIQIVLAKIIPCRSRKYNEKIKEFNRWIEKRVHQWTAEKKRLRKENNLFIADMYSVFTNTSYWGETLMSDRWYPNEQGYELMAGEWARVIKQETAETGGGHTPQ